jgi:hypothetical protein
VQHTGVNPGTSALVDEGAVKQAWMLLGLATGIGEGAAHRVWERGVGLR